MLVESKSTYNEKINLYQKNRLALQFIEGSTTPKVLLVDDNVLIQFANKQMLENLGCKVDVADNGKEALELAGKNYYDLIFMDISMPDFNGFEVTRKIRHGEYRSKEAPIVALTSYADEYVKKECILSGMENMFQKPISSEELAEVLKTYVVF